jgi:hypothetical protein
MNLLRDGELLEVEDLDVLSVLDARGLLVGPGETLADYRSRLERLDAALQEIDADLAGAEGVHHLFPDFPLRRAERIPPEIMAEAGAETGREYGFVLDWAPGFFLSRSLGVLWGGCAISFPDNGLSVFLVRAAFARKARWLIYRRQELLAHELCHAARMPLEDRDHEEWFAYRLSPSRLRRYFGNCFQADMDAVFFLLPVLVLLLAQVVQTVGLLPRLPIWPFWILAGAYPLFLAVRNHLAHRRLAKAMRALVAAGVPRPAAVLFRCTGPEIREMANLADRPAGELQKWLAARMKTELRWRVIRQRWSVAESHGG